MMKKGVVSVPMAVGVVIITAMIIIISVLVVQAAVSTAVFGSNKVAAKELALLIDTVYAAPENLEAVHEVPISTDGYPAYGTVALANGYESNNREVSEVCISQNGQTEMWMYIWNSAIAGWLGSGVAGADVMTTRSKQLSKGTEYWKVTTSKRVIKKQVEKRLLEKQMREEIDEFGVTFAKKSDLDDKLVEKAVKKIKKKNIKIKYTPTQRLGRWILKRVISKGNKILDKLTKKLWSKAVKPAFKKAFKTIAKKASATYASGAALTQALYAVPVVGPALSFVAANGVHILDYLWTTTPMIIAIHRGYSASEDMENTILCKEFTRTQPKIVADPPNCEVYADIGLTRTSTCNYSNAESYGGTVYLDETCSDCPNYFISTPEFGEQDEREKYGADAVIGGTRLICLAVTIAYPPGGMACGAAWYGGFYAAYQLAPGFFMGTLTGANILPRDDYYYMAFPSSIGVSKVYNNTLGAEQKYGSYMHIEKNKEDVQ